MNRGTRKHHLDGLAALLLFGIFAVCVLAVLLTGADAYRRLTVRDQAAYDQRTCAQYLATRVRQASGPDGVSVEPFGDGDALLLADWGDFVTRVYCYDGYLMELYTATDTDLLPEAGERIMQAGGLELSLEDGLLQISILDTEGVQSSLLLSLADGGGGAA